MYAPTLYVRTDVSRNQEGKVIYTLNPDDGVVLTSTARSKSPETTRSLQVEVDQILAEITSDLTRRLSSSFATRQGTDGWLPGSGSCSQRRSKCTVSPTGDIVQHLKERLVSVCGTVVSKRPSPALFYTASRPYTKLPGNLRDRITVKDRPPGVLVN